MNNKTSYIKSILLLIFAIALPIFIDIIDISVRLARPDITYKGDRTVPEEDIICLEKVILRDLRLDKYTVYDDGTTQYDKYYIIKKNHLSKKKLEAQLLKYCNNYYDSHNNYDKIGFYFYKECATMPWFWNDDGYFPDLEMNSEYRIYKCWVSKDGIKFKPDY